MIPMYRNRGSAFDTLVDVSREMDRLVNNVYGNGGDDRVWAMPAEIIENDDEIRVELEAPGFRSEDFDITLENNVLTISGEKKSAEETRQGEYRLAERRYGRFQRSFTVPPTVRGDDCSADYQDGVLTLRLPKAEEAKPRRIQVGANGSGRRIEEGASR